MLPPLFFNFPDLLCDTENPVEFLGEGIHILSNLVIGDASINLGCGDPLMPQHLADCFQRDTLRKRDRRSESMPFHVGLNDNPACLATWRSNIFIVL